MSSHKIIEGFYSERINIAQYVCGMRGIGVASVHQHRLPVGQFDKYAVALLYVEKVQPTFSFPPFRRFRLRHAILPRFGRHKAGKDDKPRHGYGNRRTHRRLHTAFSFLRDFRPFAVIHFSSPFSSVCRSFRARISPQIFCMRSSTEKRSSAQERSSVNADFFSSAPAL